jgi:hypothetical protein
VTSAVAVAAPTSIRLVASALILNSSLLVIFIGSS